MELESVLLGHFLGQLKWLSESCIVGPVMMWDDLTHGTEIIFRSHLKVTERHFGS